MKSLSDLQSLLNEDEKKKLAKESEEREKQMTLATERIKKLATKEMNIKYFPAFVRINFPHLSNQSNELLIEVGRQFKSYLIDIFKSDIKKLEPIWDIEPGAIVLNRMRDPFCIKGYHPALILHFVEFIEKMKKISEEEIKAEKK